ncbi:murein L,D-transpeptidase catalytic domain family protein [Sphingomonas sp. HDW15A]|uniref:murein L,D-transpeptidase catalytic domain family protein n=1 Tax=Sphingomonas sp. HDW15A TaxID=2714942 RepID=UPI001F0F3482|nr:murein L,D-transpeptidase catalytic domain family protein [Sphingomonas sp. HDW15A]
MLRLGAAGAGGLLLSAAGRTADLPGAAQSPFALGRDPLRPVPPLPAAQPTAPAGVNPALFQRAKAALDSRSYIRQRDFVGVADFTLPSAEPRFHVIHMASGQVESFRVAHGSGSDPAHSGFLDHFSNRPGSEATSNGAYMTADTYDGKYGLSMKVHGLDWSNNNAMARAIVIHNAWYAEPEMVAIHGKLGRSQGCFAFSRADHWKVMNRLGSGSLIYADKLA